MGLSWWLAQFCSSCCEREREATARDTAAGQAGLAGCPAEILSPCIHHPPACLHSGRKAKYPPSRGENTAAALPSSALASPLRCCVAFRRLSSRRQRVRLFVQVVMSVKERVGVDEALQSVNFPQRLLTPTASASPEMGNVGLQRAQQPRASGACHRLPRHDRAARWVHAVRQ